MLGMEIAKLVNEDKSAGIHSLKYDAALLPSGIYFYRLESGSYVQTKKMILLH
jgi:hypothetical protein